jgi:hypothetical protein
MSEFDLFSDQLLGEAKRFLEKVCEASDATGKAAYLHAALILAFCALEARINSISEEARLRTDLTLHDQGILLEREVRLEKGEFKLTSSLKITRVEDRIEFLHVRLSGKSIDKTNGSWWSRLQVATHLRNELTHPKAIPTITEANVGSAIQAIIDTIDALSRAIYNKKYPTASEGLKSRFEF